MLISSMDVPFFNLRVQYRGVTVLSKKRGLDATQNIVLTKRFSSVHGLRTVNIIELLKTFIYYSVHGDVPPPEPKCLHIFVTFSSSKGDYNFCIYLLFRLTITSPRIGV